MRSVKGSSRGILLHMARLLLTLPGKCPIEGMRDQFAEAARLYDRRNSKPYTSIKCLVAIIRFGFDW